MAKEMMNKVENSISKEIVNMKKASDISPIRDDLETLKEDARVLRDDAVVLGRDLKEEGRKQYSRAEEKAKQAVEEAKEKGKDQYAAIAAFVQDNPGQSLGIAFAAGILASLLLRSSRG